jgi:hypothetical protein
MKKILFLLTTLIAFINHLLAQTDDLQGFAIIKDKDRFTNVREKPTAKSAIDGTIKEDEIFYCLWNEGHEDWYQIDYKNGSGFIHKSRIKSLYSLPQIKKNSQVKDTLFLTNDSITVIITKAKFVKSQHKITNDKNGRPHKIDGKEPWGLDGNLPKICLKSLEIKVNGELIDIPKNDLMDLFEPNFNSTGFYFNHKNICYLVMSNSDGAGSYSIVFEIKDKKYIKRHIYRGF